MYYLNNLSRKKNEGRVVAYRMHDVKCSYKKSILDNFPLELEIKLVESSGKPDVSS